MMPFSVETLVPSGPRNLGQSLPWALASDETATIRAQEKMIRRMIGPPRLSWIFFQPGLHCSASILAIFSTRRACLPPSNRGVEPDADHLHHLVLAEQVGRQAQDVGVVMASAHLGGEDILAGGGADAATLLAVMLMPMPVPQIKRPPALHFTAADPFGDLEGEIGVIDAFRPIGADVEHLMSQRTNQGEQSGLDFHAAMVAADDDVHTGPPFTIPKSRAIALSGIV